MISLDVAVSQVDRLYANYNASANHQIKEAKVKFIIEELKGFTNDSFVKICDLILRESKNKTFPVMEDFVSRLHLVNTVAEYANNTFCNKCGETGYYNIWETRGGRWYSFPYRCPCNSSTMTALPIAPNVNVPAEPHNPYPPNDDRHEIHRARRGI